MNAGFAASRRLATSLARTALGLRNLSAALRRGNATPPNDAFAPVDGAQSSGPAIPSGPPQTTTPTRLIDCELMESEALIEERDVRSNPSQLHSVRVAAGATRRQRRIIHRLRQSYVVQPIEQPEVEAPPPPPPPAAQPNRHPGSSGSADFIGVVREDPASNIWEAVITVNGREISGGEYESVEDAARAYDALARMYLGSRAETNFPHDPYTGWVPPDATATSGHIEPIRGVPLTVDEIVAALKQERGIDVQVVDLAGRSSIAEHLIFATGKSVPHMRKMADMVARALRQRRLKGVDASVEGRDMDDWMLVDAGNIIVNVMDAEAREVFDLERFYTNMKLGEDPYAGMTYEQWLEENPIPEKWLARLERDELELAARGGAAAKGKR